MQFVCTQTGVQDTQPNRRACGSPCSPLGFKKASTAVLLQTPYFRLYETKFDSVKALPAGKPHPLNSSDHSGFFSHCYFRNAILYLPSFPRLVFMRETESEWSGVDGRWNSCSEGQFFIFFACVLCVVGCCFPPPQRVCSVFTLPSAISKCLILCWYNWAACVSPYVVHTKWICCRTICEDQEDMFMSTCTCNKCYSNLTFGLQWTLLKIPDAVSKQVVFPGWQVRNQTERTSCDGFLWLSRHDPRVCMIQDAISKRF